MKTNKDAAKEIILGYFNWLAYSKENPSLELINEKIQIQTDDKLLLEHMKALHSIFEKAIDELEGVDNEDEDIEEISIDEKSVLIKGTRFYREKDIEIFQKLSMTINELVREVNKLKKEGK